MRQKGENKGVLPEGCISEQVRISCQDGSINEPVRLYDVI